MQAEFLEILSMIFMILTIFFLTASVVIWFGLGIFHDISVLTGLGAKIAIRKMRKETNGKQKKFASIKTENKKGALNRENTGKTIESENIAATTIIDKSNFEETVLLNK